MCKENTVSGQPGSRDCIRPVEFQMSMSLLLIGYARPSVGEVDSIMPSGCEMPNRRFVCVCANPMNGPSNRTRTRRIILQRHMCRKKPRQTADMSEAFSSVAVVFPQETTGSLVSTSVRDIC